MINAEVMKALGPRGVIINVARGTVVDEQAMIAALKSGTILAAGLDVFEKEPNVPDELKAMQNVVLLPHIGSASVVTRNAMDQLVVDNLKAWFAGKPPLTPVAETPARPADERRRDHRRGRPCWRRWPAAPPARAQDASTLKKDMIGQWELSTTERSKTCVVTLKGDASPQGFKLELEPGCADGIAVHRRHHRLEHQGTGDIVRLQDAAGQPVIDFTEVETGIFEGLRTGEGVYILQNLAAARSLAKSMDQMIGDWAMVRGNGQAICGLTLTNTEAGQDNFQVFLKPKCDPAVAAFAPTQWRLEHGQILLHVGQRRNLDVRGRRQRPVAAGARQRRSADHAAAVAVVGAITRINTSSRPPSQDPPYSASLRSSRRRVFSFECCGAFSPPPCREGLDLPPKKWTGLSCF